MGPTSRLPMEQWSSERVRGYLNQLDPPQSNDCSLAVLDPWTEVMERAPAYSAALGILNCSFGPALRSLTSTALVLGTLTQERRRELGRILLGVPGHAHLQLQGVYGTLSPEDVRNSIEAQITSRPPREIVMVLAQVGLDPAHPHVAAEMVARSHDPFMEQAFVEHLSELRTPALMRRFLLKGTNPRVVAQAIAAIITADDPATTHRWTDVYAQTLKMLPPRRDDLIQALNAFGRLADPGCEALRSAIETYQARIALKEIPHSPAMAAP